ncbi:hypothetical protein LXA43DRAFT_1188106 [Ganoderma leucocontextum]|nr:hypothetical protein LXA43DRAFT_1188106 [Ganoderma leucocontextum]
MPNTPTNDGPNYEGSQRPYNFYVAMIPIMLTIVAVEHQRRGPPHIYYCLLFCTLPQRDYGQISAE